MTKTREKKVLIQGVSRERAEEAFAEYAAADALQQQFTSKMDGEITRIREKYQDKINDSQERKELSFEIMQAFATEKKDELFAKKKSLEMVHGIMGFRTGTPKLKTRKGFTWGAVTNLLKELMPGYVRTTEEPAKDKLLADRDDPAVAGMYVKIGVYVDQDETFFVEPKKEILEA
jgi:phage host-nuclease inhibitor protein Gam